MFVDVHCHLDQLEKIEEAVKNAKKAGVNKIITNAVDLNSIQKSLELAAKFDEVKACIGLHPMDVLRMEKKEIEEAFELIEKNLGNCTGIGEIGLDNKYARKTQEKEFQEEIFKRQLEIALKKVLPVEVHSRYAEKRTLEILEEKKLEKVLMHWFTNLPNEIEKAIESGYYISVGPSILSFESTQENVRKIPLENLMLETDAPVPYSGKSSSPSWVLRVAEKVAEVKALSIEEVEEKTTANARKLFGL